jgi:hypothetical protein
MKLKITEHPVCRGGAPLDTFFEIRLLRLDNPGDITLFPSLKGISAL